MQRSNPRPLPRWDQADDLHQASRGQSSKLGPFDGATPTLQKSRTRLNAVTHGLTAETLILPGEDPRDFQRLLDHWTAQLEPANPFEHDLVRQVATLSWRLDRADRVQDALIADSLGTDTAEQRRAEVADLGRRLLPPPRVPNFVRRFGVWADLDRLAHRGPDDPDDPPRLLLRLEATADGCRWLLDRWAVLRTIVDAGTPWPDEPMVQAIRLLGKRPFDAVNDLQVLTIIVATYVLDRSRPDPFAELWKTTTDREAIYYRQRLLGRRLREAKPRSKEHAREVLLEIVDAAVSRLEEQEQVHRRREADLAALRPEILLFDASAEGEWVRREQRKATRAILRITERFRKARRRGETLSADPPKPPRLEPMAIRPLEIRPVVGPQKRMENPYQRPGREGADPAAGDPRRPEPAAAAGVHRRSLGGTSQGDQERPEVQGEAVQSGASGEDRDPWDRVAGATGAGAADHRLAGDDRRRAVIGSARGLCTPRAPGDPRRRTRSFLAGSSRSGIAVPPPESGLRPPKWPKRTQRWRGCADFAGPAAASRVLVRSVARSARRERRPFIDRSSLVHAPVRRGAGAPCARRYLLIHDRCHIGTSFYHQAPDRREGT